MSAAAASCLRVDFVSQAPAGQTVLRSWSGANGPVVGVAVPITLSDFKDETSLPITAPKASASLYIMYTPARDGAPQLTEPVVRLDRDGLLLEWGVGRAIVSGGPILDDETIVALAEFAFYEGELRGLEQKLALYEPSALEDVGRAHRIRASDRGHWERFRATIEEMNRLRIQFARLEGHFTDAARDLPRDARRLTGRLLRRASAPARATDFGERLEVMEDLYEGANDRVADYRWYLGGTILEVTIVILLLVEAIIMGADVYVRLHG